MMAVRYHGCTCHQRYSQQHNLVKDGQSLAHTRGHDMEATRPDDLTVSASKDGEVSKPQPWYFHVVASVILVIHGLTFLVPTDIEDEDTDMVRTVARWFGYELDWVRHFTPYAQVYLLSKKMEIILHIIALFQGLASVFNISLGLVSWWTSKDSERYNRLIQLRVFAFCLNILHAYITGPIIYQSSEEMPIMTPGKTGIYNICLSKETKDSKGQLQSSNNIEFSCSFSTMTSVTPAHISPGVR